MTGNEYQALAMKTANPEFMNLALVGLGLSGESGECSDLIKKHLYHGHELDKERLKKELGDVCWYIALGCEIIGCSMDDVMQENIDKLKKRYPNGFEKERSLYRDPGDI